MKQAILNGIPRERRILVLWEPSIVDRRIYDKNILDLYGHIFSPSVEWNSHKLKNFSYFNWPQDKVESIENFENWSQRVSKIAVIQGNKFSARNGELYSLRRKVISSRSVDLDLYGNNWNEGFLLDSVRWLNSVRKSRIRDFKSSSISKMGKKYPNYKGTVDSKFETLNKYRFSLVIENMNTYVSEKLFDSISAGCLTIYIGANLALHGIPHENVITSKPDFNEIDKVLNQIMGLSTKEQFKIAENQNRDFLNLNSRHNNEIILKQLAQRIIYFID